MRTCSRYCAENKMNNDTDFVPLLWAHLDERWRIDEAPDDEDQYVATLTGPNPAPPVPPMPLLRFQSKNKWDAYPPIFGQVCFISTFVHGQEMIGYCKLAFYVGYESMGLQGRRKHYFCHRDVQGLYDGVVADPMNVSPVLRRTCAVRMLYQSVLRIKGAMLRMTAELTTIRDAVNGPHFAEREERRGQALDEWRERLERQRLTPGQILEASVLNKWTRVGPRLGDPF